MKDLRSATSTVKGLNIIIHVTNGGHPSRALLAAQLVLEASRHEKNPDSSIIQSTEEDESLHPVGVDRSALALSLESNEMRLQSIVLLPLYPSVLKVPSEPGNHRIRQEGARLDPRPEV